MNKKGQMAFSPEDLSQSMPSQNFSESEKPQNLFQRIALGIVAIVFLIIFAPILVSISSGVVDTVCTEPTVCLFFKFIVPAFILGGIIGAIKYVWDKQ